MATVDQNTPVWRGEQTVDATSGGGGAPTNATYVTISHDATLTNERTLAVGSPITLADGGANNSVTLDFDETVALGNNARVAVYKGGVGPKGTRRALNFIEGANTTITVADNAGAERVDVTIDVSAAGGAPDNAQYIVATANGTLTAERVATDTATLVWDFATAGQAKATVPNLSGTNTGDQTITLTGDVTGSGTGTFTASITNNAVTDAKLRDSGACSVIGRSANASGDPADISASTNDTVFSRSSNVLGFSAVSLAMMATIATDRLLGRDTAGTGIPEVLTVSGGVEFTGSGGIQRSSLTGDVTATAGSNTTAIGANKVLDTMLRDSGACSVIGRSANSGGDPADISAGSNDLVLSRSANSVSFQTVSTAMIANDAVTYAKIQNVSAASVLLGRGAGSGSGDAQEIALGTGLSMSGTTLSASFVDTALTTMILGSDDTSTLAILTSPSDLQFIVDPGSLYSFEFYGVWQSSSTTNGIAFSMGHAVTLVDMVQYNVRTSLTATTTFERWETAFDAVNPTASIDTANVDRFVRISGICQISPLANVGVEIGLRYASENDTVAVTLKAGSTLFIRKLS